MRIIAHLDLDAFFASVEERENPRLKGLPIVVGADPAPKQVWLGTCPMAEKTIIAAGRGVVSTANYAARAYGICSALPISKAWELSEQAVRQGSPAAVFLTGSYRKYAEVSQAVIEIVKKYSTITEQSGIDEIYIDLTQTATPPAFLKGTFRKAEEICLQIKREIKKKEKLTASIGLSSNKLVAKIASDMQKPDGLTVVLPKDIESFLEPLSVRKIPGIGPKTEKRLNELKIYKVADLKKYTLAQMDELLGKWGVALYYKIRGIDDSPVTEKYERKSIGEQVTFQKDTLEFSEIVAKMEKLCRGVFQSFQKSGFKNFRTVVLTVRFADFEIKTRSHTLLKPQRDLKTIKTEAIKLLMPFFDARRNPGRKRVRLIGIRIEKLA